MGPKVANVTDVDPWSLYSSLRDETIALIRPLDVETLNQAVPLTPGWSNRQVVAHLCGLAADVISGVREGLGTDERTDRQVAERADRSVHEVCDEWLSHGAELGMVIDGEPVMGLRLSADLVVHLHDMQHGLGTAVDRDSNGSVSGGRTYASRSPDRIADVANIALTIELSDGSSFEPTVDVRGLSSLKLRATPYDFLRSVTGRRSRSEVRALDWSDDPGSLLDVFSPYGSLRSEDAGA